MKSALIALALSLGPLLAPSALAQAAPHCEPGQAPQFVFGFATLKAQLGAAMGEPVSCEYADPNGTGDTLQDTSAGLAFWRKSTNTPTFTDGTTHWALENEGLVSWTGDSIDPPAAAVAATLPSAATPAPSVQAASPAPAAQPAQSRAASPSAPPVQPVPPAPAAKPTLPIAPPAPSTNTCGAPTNPWGYTFCSGTVISAAPTNFCSVFACIPSFWNQTNGYVVQCADGLFSHSGGVRGSCSSHHGNGRTLYEAR